MEFKQVAKILPVFKKQKKPQLNVLYFLLNVAIAKTSFLYPSTLPPCAAVPGCTILPSPSCLPGKGSLLRLFSFSLQHSVQMLPCTSPQLPPSYGKWSTAASGKSWCKCKMCSKGIDTEMKSIYTDQKKIISEACLSSSQTSLPEYIFSLLLPPFREKSLNFDHFSLC